MITFQIYLISCCWFFNLWVPVPQESCDPRSLTPSLAEHLVETAGLLLTQAYQAQAHGGVKPGGALCGLRSWGILE